MNSLVEPAFNYKWRPIRNHYRIGERGALSCSTGQAITHVGTSAGQETFSILGGVIQRLRRITLPHW